MKVPRIVKALNNIDYDMISSADEFQQKKNKKQLWIKWGAIAACICMISAIAFPLSNLLNNKHSDINTNRSNYEAVYWGDNRERNGINVTPSESGIEWPWEYRTAYEQFTSVKWKDKIYQSNVHYNGNEIPPSYIGKRLNDASAEGFCHITNKSYSIYCEIFELKGIDSNKYIAVKLEGSDIYYPFCSKQEFTPPATLGELINSLSLKHHCKLNVGYDYSIFSDDYREQRFYLENEKSNTLWDIITKYSSAEFVNLDFAHSDKILSFSVTSFAMGFYNKSFGFTNDGYIVTNIEDYRYAFYIGEDAIKEIVDYALSNKANLPTVIDLTCKVAGTVTEIGEDYIKIDDSVLMKNPQDGIEFTVKTTDLRIRRYIDLGIISVGSQVVIEHKGTQEDNHSFVNNAFYLSECIFTADNEILIPE